MTEEYAVMVGGVLRGIARCTDAGWEYLADGRTVARSGGARSCDVIPFKRAEYRLAPI